MKSMTNFEEVLTFYNVRLMVTCNVVENQLFCKQPTKCDILLKISLNTQAPKDSNPTWDFSNTISVLMKFSCLVDSDIQLIFTGHYPYKRAAMA